jgi:hypothetical protein
VVVVITTTITSTTIASGRGGRRLVVLLSLALVLLLVGVGVLVLVLVVPVLFAEEGSDGCESEDEEGAAAVLWGEVVLVTRKDREEAKEGGYLQPLLR